MNKMMRRHSQRRK